MELKRPIDPLLMASFKETYGQLPVITKDEFTSVIKLLISPDFESRDLGANLLFQTNFLTIPETVTMLVKLYPCPLLFEMEWLIDKTESTDYDKELINILTNMLTDENIWKR